MRLAELFEEPRNLPAVPAVVASLLASFDDEDVQLDVIARDLKSDPTLSAKLLRLANSAYFNVSRTVGNVDEALRLLGFVVVRNLVVGVGVSAACKGTPGLDMPSFWRFSLVTACVARWLAKSAGQGAERAFTVGLLHGIGQVVLHTALPEPMASLDAAVPWVAAERVVAERAALGYDHAEVGEELARRWRFPEELAVAIGRVPYSARGGAGDTIAGIVSVAAWRARLDLRAKSGAEDVPAPSREFLARLGLSDVCWSEADQDEGAEARVMPAVGELTAGFEDMFR